MQASRDAKQALLLARPAHQLHAHRHPGRPAQSRHVDARQAEQGPHAAEHRIARGIEAARPQVEGLMRDVDALLVPSAPGEAPRCPAPAGTCPPRCRVPHRAATRARHSSGRDASAIRARGCAPPRTPSPSSARRPAPPGCPASRASRSRRRCPTRSARPRATPAHLPRRAAAPRACGTRRAAATPRRARPAARTPPAAARSASAPGRWRCVPASPACPTRARTA